MSRILHGAVDETLLLAASDLLGEVEFKNNELFLAVDSLEDTLYVRLQEQGFSVRVLDLAGLQVRGYGPYINIPQPNVPLMLPDQPGVFTTTIDPSSRDPVRVYTSSVTIDGQAAGTLQVAQNLNSLIQTLRLLLVTLFISGPLVVVVAGSGGYFLAAKALDPIDKITRTARQISAAGLSARLNLSETDDEVGRLAATFDSMLARLEDAFRRERQFTADASHELRIPLSAMQTIIGSTLARPRAPEAYEQALVDLQ